jgi:cyanophycin synthetase
MGFGLREPALVGVVRARLPERLDPGAFDRAMRQLTGETLPEDIEGGPIDLMSLAARAAFWDGAIQRRAQIPVFGRAYIARQPKSDRVRVALPFYEAGASSATLAWIEAALNEFLGKEVQLDAGAQRLRAQWNELSKILEKFRPTGQNMFKYLRDAHEKNIPARQFLPGMHCVGTGCRSRWLQSSFTDRTALLASRIAGNKFLTAQVLRRAGLPAATHSLVKTAEEAVSVAHQLGYPVVVKPADRQQGIGVAANLNSDAAVIAAFDEACKASKLILVEKHFDGTDYRMVVLEGRLLRVRGRVPGGVFGDGKSTIAQLVEIRKQTPDSQRRAHERGRHLLDLDAEALSILAENGLDQGDVPEAGRYIRLRRRGNVSTGGESTMIKDADIHPDNVSLAVRAAAALRLDFAGVDAILPDISSSWIETGGLICEVNAQPQASTDILGELLGGNGRIPIIVALGRDERLDRKSLRASIPQCAGFGFASINGMWLDDDRLAGRQTISLAAGQAILDDQRTEAAVVVMTPMEVARFGLPADQIDALLLDDPASWSEEDRGALGSALELALPHSLVTIALRPDPALLDSKAIRKAADDGRWRVEAGDLQGACERQLARLLSTKNATTVTS